MDCKTIFKLCEACPEIEVYDSPQYPIEIQLLENAIRSKFQDGYVTSRPRVSMNLSKYTLNFKSVKMEEKNKIQDIEKLVGTSEIFIWIPNVPLDSSDYQENDQGETVIAIQERKVRLIEPINFQLSSYNKFDFTMSLQQSILTQFKVYDG
jgi:hypothetical protein